MNQLDPEVACHQQVRVIAQFGFESLPLREDPLFVLRVTGDIVETLFVA